MTSHVAFASPRAGEIYSSATDGVSSIGTSTRVGISDPVFQHHQNLRKLYITFNYEDETYHHEAREDIHWDLTEMVPLLDHLDVSDANVEPPLCSAISEHPSISHLRLHFTCIKESNLAVFWEACRNLESLEMTEINFKEGSMSVPRDAVFNRMRKLTIEGIERLSPSEQLDLVFHCPKLKTLEWDPVGPIRVGVLINHPIQKDRWPKLDELRIPSYLQDTEMASTLEGIGNCFGKIVELKMSNSTFGPQASRALGFHFSTLVKLDICYFASVNGPGIQDVLCFCSMLEVLWAPSICARDIAEDGSWACQHLRELWTRIRVKETEQDLHQLIFERLSTLVRLATLDMGNSFDNGDGYGVLEFRLDCGLRQLACLHELRTVEFYHGPEFERKQRLEVNDIEWMIDNWKRLKRIGGRLSRDPEVEVQLKEVSWNHYQLMVASTTTLSPFLICAETLTLIFLHLIPHYFPSSPPL
ncbi:hypothetical protein BGX34_002128 [Mortierella sp. NVP85]|nr:hypothetical protein BGX34_002128 [Mortierella sp. NVP85]